MVKAFLYMLTRTSAMRRVCIRTLAPPWTRDIDRKRSSIKETAVLGSLRRWYHALVSDGKLSIKEIREVLNGALSGVHSSERATGMDIFPEVVKNES